MKPQRGGRVRCSAWLGGCSVVMLCLALTEMWWRYRTAAIIIGCTALPLGLLCLVVVILAELRGKADERRKATHEIEAKRKCGGGTNGTLQRGNAPVVSVGNAVDNLLKADAANLDLVIRRDAELVTRQLDAARLVGVVREETKRHSRNQPDELESEMENTWHGAHG